MAVNERDDLLACYVNRSYWHIAGLYAFMGYKKMSKIVKLQKRIEIHQDVEIICLSGAFGHCFQVDLPGGFIMETYKSAEDAINAGKAFVDEYMNYNFPDQPVYYPRIQGRVY